MFKWLFEEDKLDIKWIMFQAIELQKRRFFIMD